ncbi:MAG: hypothetical protein K5752_04435 [Succinivibrionaceae bacterium]|nr:hypothetical protein [Succinivibrionaceae bacterium]
MSFKEEFERYREAINNDIKEIELVIAWLEQYKANFEDAEISKVISFFRGCLSRAKLEKTKVQELSWYIDEK